ncbi:MAG: transcription-repair coupling factor [Candidatus Muiribacteriaceae bacterium]
MRLENYADRMFSDIRGRERINDLFGDSILLFPASREGKNIIVFPSQEEAEEACEKLKSLIPEKDFIFYPEWDRLFFDNTEPAKEIEGNRIRALYEFNHSENPILITSAKAFFHPIIPIEILNKYTEILEKNDDISIEGLTDYLIKTGYSRKDTVSDPGDFCVRGEVIDVWCFEHTAIRLDCPFDKLEEIIRIDPDTGRSTGQQLEKYVLLPAREVIQDAHNEDPAALYDIFPYNYTDTPEFLSGLEGCTDIFFIHGDRIKDIHKEFREELKRFDHPEYTLCDDLEGIKAVFVSNTVDYSREKKSATGPVPNFDRDIKKLSQYIIGMNARGYSVVFYFDNNAKMLRFREVLKEYSVDLLDANQYFPGKTEFFAVLGALTSGFISESIRTVFIGEDNIWGKSPKNVHRKVRRKKSDKNLFSVFTELKPGDNVVHVDHGIGIYKGITRVKVGRVQTREFFHIQYAGKDELFVPIENADAIHKYVGKENPSLYTLDGKKWSKTTGKVKKKVRKIARDLIKLYAERLRQNGIAFLPDTQWQHELEASFPYDETKDQINVLKDIKEDMEKDVPMDRLVCGDVGYGKTELAIRAAFKAVMSGRQVAVLAPTTILTEQHYETFTERYKMFPVKVDRLSRLKKDSENRETSEKVMSGETDVIIGTHKLLGKSIRYKDLGLLIVDEEQRFGVEHKEKIKQLRKNIDVLTMTATPIPRTLNMAMNGIRDISVIETAPDNRLPVRTFVAPYSEEVAREAILRELGRGGQVYYLYNRVAGIELVRNRLESSMPGRSFAVAHGQMTRKEMNDRMHGFISGKIDVLITTTIIESGIDIPNVNTIIVEDADRFGLSQLYQLKGRVGRSERQAYAYLFYNGKKILTENARKRLATLREFTDLGSGFRISMKDLEIRGSGNVFGKEQHGFVDEVGFEMYCNLLREVIAEEKGDIVEELPQIRFSLPINAFVPDYFENDRKRKIDLYRKIASTITMEEYQDMYEDVKDRYRRLPDQVKNLLNIQKIKIMGRKCGLVEVRQYDSRNILLRFRSLEFTEEGLGDFIRKFGDKINLKITVSDGICVKVPKQSASTLYVIQKILQHIPFCVKI